MKFVNAFDTGGANLGESHTKSMGDGFVDIRAKAQEGSGRFFCYLDGKRRREKKV